MCSDVTKKCGFIILPLPTSEPARTLTEGVTTQLNPAITCLETISYLTGNVPSPSDHFLLQMLRVGPG